MSGRFLTCWISIALAAPAVAQPNRIASSIDNSRTVLLSGRAHRLANAASDAGRVESGFPIAGITLTLARSAAQQADLDQLLLAQQNPSSPHFHQWLTPEQFADRFGTSRSDLAQIQGWLHSQGFTLDYTARSRTYVTFSGTAQQVQNTFHTEIHRYTVGGQIHYANASDPSIPEALAGLVSGLRGLDDFHPQPLNREAQPQLSGSRGTHYLGPADFATIYDVTPLYNQGIDGTGQTIAVAGQTAISTSDIDLFRSKFNLGPKNFEAVLVPDNGTNFGNAGSVVEADLDIEWSGAVAPKAKIVYVFAPDAWTAAEWVIDQKLAPVLSYSFGYGCELYDLMDLTNWRATVQQGNAEGVTMLVASGDLGAAGCEFLDNPYPVIAQSGLGVAEPASIPEVTAMGGSEFNEGSGTYWNSDGSAMSYIPEQAWNDTALAGVFMATGGGASIYFAQPPWQSGPGVPTDGWRHIPDLAFPASPAHDPVYIYTGGAAALVGGTSCAAPMMAGVLALLNQYLAQTKPGLGNINPALYRMAQSTSGVFNDILTGDNMVPCAVGSPDCPNGSLGWTAGPGYDSVTGLGSLDVSNFVQQWSSAAPVNASVVASSSQNPVTQTTPDASGNSWRFQLRLTEEAGIGATLTGFTIGSADYSSQIAGLFGTTAIPPGGSIFASYGFQSLPDPSNVVFGFSGVDASGAQWSTTLTVPFQGPQTPMTVGGISNAASGQQAYAPGMILSVYGAGMGDFAQAAGATPLPSMMAGLEAWVFDNGNPNGVSTPLYYVSPNQVNLQIPYVITPGPAQLILGGPWTSAAYSFTVSAAAPGIFMFADGSVNPSSTAHAGDTVAIYITGDGLTSPPVLAGWTPSEGVTPQPQQMPSITVGGIAVAQPFAFIGIPSWSVGVTQINFSIPANVPAGPQPVVVTVGSASSFPATITIMP
jgi:uncharacterized protein (TIGR03437 family)